MKHILKEGEISLLLPEGEGGGLSGEVHLIKHHGKKYVMRRCKELKKAKNYEKISKRFQHHGFLPKYLGRYGKDVFYEYIDGRDLREKETLDIFYQLGVIEATLNKVKVHYNFEKKVNLQLQELVTGNYKATDKVLMRRYKDRLSGSRFDRRRIKAVLSREQLKAIKTIYNQLKLRVNPITTLDGTDILPGNFRIRKGKVYFVDVEAIKPQVKGFGIAKHFLKWAKTKNKQRAFLKGYMSIAPLHFFTESYKDFCYLIFTIQALNYKAQIGRDYKSDLEFLDILFIKYKV